MLKEFAQRGQQQTGSLEVESEDFMDDGTPIRLRVQINEEEVWDNTLYITQFNEGPHKFISITPRTKDIRLALIKSNNMIQCNILSSAGSIVLNNMPN